MAVGIPGGCSSPWESQGCCKIEVAGSKVPRHQGWSEKSPISLCRIHLLTAVQLGRCQETPSQPGIRPPGSVPTGMQAHATVGSMTPPAPPCVAMLTAMCPSAPPWHSGQASPAPSQHSSVGNAPARGPSPAGASQTRPGSAEAGWSR